MSTEQSLREQTLREEICEMGRRMYAKDFAAGHDGNISARLDDERFLCTPTKICKGFMKPDDLCIVDGEGRQLEGKRKRTSEVLLHLLIMRERPSIRAVVHCHPPHATAFGIAREALPQRVLPEVEVLLGEVPIAAYAIPGGDELAAAILPFVHDAQAIIQANHGTVTFGTTVEEAYWHTEILDAYCRTLLLLKSLGHIGYLTEGEMRDLLALKKRLGLSDPRYPSSATPDAACSQDVFRATWPAAGIAHRAFQPPYE
ncbi:MAG: class II aldolase/adducin family protein [Thermoguttaceae bacterium]